MKNYYHKGRGAQINTLNSFNAHFIERDNADIDLPVIKPDTQIFNEYPRNIISENKSPDIPFRYSINPYQGCEHGCVYCYARNTHEYWGFSAGLDFESKIISKPNAPELLRKQFLRPGWKPEMIMLSGNTDCYQPIERKLKITRGLLQVMNDFGNPVTIITKNVLVLRDLDIIKSLSRQNLVHVIFSISTLDEELRLKMEPRTASGRKRLLAIRKLSNENIPVSVMISPVIPGLNNHEVPTIIRESAEAGAVNVHMTKVRLNGRISIIFRDWLAKSFPDRADRVWNLISSMHNGHVNESRWGVRMTGSGKMAESVDLLYKTVKNHYFPNPAQVKLSHQHFKYNGMGSLFASESM